MHRTKSEFANHNQPSWNFSCTAIHLTLLNINCQMQSRGFTCTVVCYRWATHDLIMNASKRLNQTKTRRLVATRTMQQHSWLEKGKEIVSEPSLPNPRTNWRRRPYSSSSASSFSWECVWICVWMKSLGCNRTILVYLAELCHGVPVAAASRTTCMH